MYAYMCTREHAYIRTCADTHHYTHYTLYTSIGVCMHTHTYAPGRGTHTSSRMHAHGTHIYTNTYHLAHAHIHIEIFLYIYQERLAPAITKYNKYYRVREHENISGIVWVVRLS